MTGFEPQDAYFHGRGFTDPKYNALAFACRNPATTRSETGFMLPSIRIDYRDLAGKPTGHSRWRLLGEAADGRKFHQLPKTGNHPYFPLFSARSKKRWTQIAKNPKERIVITEGEFKAAAAALAGIVTIGIGGVESWHETGNKKLLAELLLINWKKRPVELVPDADHATNSNVRRGFLGLADALTELGAIVSIRPIPDVTGTGKTGLDDFLAKRDADEFEELPVFGMDSDLLKRWRQDLLDGSDLPDFELLPLDPAWLTEQLPPLEYTVAGLIPCGTVTLLVSEGGVGKTFLALELARTVATGDDFLRLPTRPGGVVYIGLEDPPDILRRRVYNAHLRRLAEVRSRVDLSRPYEQKVEEMQGLLLEHLRVASLAGQELHLVGLQGGVTVQTPALDELIEQLRGDPIELLILDPMARLHGGDENANATGTAIINAAERIAGEIGCSVVITHHTGKAAATRDDAYAARGASGIADAARVVLRLRMLHEKEFKSITDAEPEDFIHNFLKLVHAKCNYSPRLQDLWLKRNELGQLTVFTPSFKDAGNHYTGMLEQLGAWLKKQPGDGRLTQRTIYDHYSEIFKGSPRKAALDFFDEAVERGNLKAAGNRRGGDLYALDLDAKEKPTNDD